MSGNDYLGYMNNYYLQGNSNNRFLGYTLGGNPSNLNVDYNIPKYEYKPIVGSAFNYSSLYSQPTTGTSSSTNDWRASIEAENRARIERIRQAQARVDDEVAKMNESVLFKGLGITKQEEAILLNEHSKTHEMYYKLTTGLGLSVGMGAVAYNGGLVSHGINTFKTLGKNSDTTLMFKGESNAIKKAFRGTGADAKRAEAMKKLWKENDNLIQEAYYQMHKAERRTHSMLGANKKRFNKNSGVYKKMKKEMENALTKAMKTGNTDDLARVTCAMKEANGVSDGWLRRGTKRVKVKGGRKYDSYHDKYEIVKKGKAWRKNKKTPEEVFDSLMKISKNRALSDSKKAPLKSFAENLKHFGGKNAKMTAKGVFKIGGGKATAIMSLFSLLFEIPNICKAFKSSKKEGWTQVKQSLVKVGLPSLLSLGGEIGAKLIGVKIGGAIGSVLPGLGTFIGAGLGLLISTLVFNGSAMAGREVVGDNVVNDIKTQEIAKSENGAEEILQTLMTQAEAGEIKDERALGILQRLNATA